MSDTTPIERGQDYEAQQQARKAFLIDATRTIHELCPLDIFADN